MPLFKGNMLHMVVNTSTLFVVVILLKGGVTIAIANKIDPV